MDAAGTLTRRRRGVFEGAVAHDLARRVALVAPALVLLAGIVRGWDGAISAAIALGLVALNFLVSARLIAWGAGKSLVAVQVAVLGGFVVRLGALLLIVIGLGRLSFVDVPVLVVTLAVTHIGLLVWESRYVSLSLASPGLKPAKTEH